MADSFEAVKVMLAEHGKEGLPPISEVQRISWAFHDINNRLMKVRCISPTTDLTDRMWKMMEMVGIPNRALPRSSPRKR